MRPNAYLGTQLLNGIPHHRWLDGTVLPVLSGGAGDDADDQPDDTEDTDDDDSEDGDDTDDDESTLTHKQRANLHRASRQAARFRITAKNERERADLAEERANATLIELAFTRAAGQQFADLDAAWKLIDKDLIEIDSDGTVTGADEAVEALLADHPFIAAVHNSNDEKPGANPFRPTSSGSPMTGKKRPNAEPSAAKLAAKYPALRRR